MGFLKLTGLPALLFAAGACLGQSLESATARLDSSGGVEYRASFAFSPPARPEPPVTGAAFSAEEVVDEMKHLDNGTRSERSQQLRRVFRDGQGRTRTERHLLLGAEGAEGPLVAEIADLPGGCHYTLDLVRKVAHRYRWPAAGTAVAEPPNGAKVAQLPDTAAKLVPEPLGRQLIEGLTAEGTRYSKAIPRDGGLSRILSSEIWISTELKVALLTRIADSEGGAQTVHLKNVRRTEPPAALFQVPPDFAIEDETGEFRIAFAVAAAK